MPARLEVALLHLLVGLGPDPQLARVGQPAPPPGRASPALSAGRVGGSGGGGRRLAPGGGAAPGRARRGRASESDRDKVLFRSGGSPP